MGGEIVGRGEELDWILTALDHLSMGPKALLLEGDAGIGKTILWDAAVAAARSHAYTVLACRPAQSESRLAFGALGDLLERVDAAVLGLLPDPQADALEVALLRRGAGPDALDQRTVAVAFLGALRLIGLHGPVLLAIDDVQWLDPASVDAIRFALRRLHDEPIAVLATLRVEEESTDPLALDVSLGEGAVVRRRLTPLDPPELYELVRTRLDIHLRRPLLVQVHATSGGNPFFALELVRALGPGQKAATSPHVTLLTVPGSLGELLLARIRQLDITVTRMLLMAAALAQPTVSVLEAAIGRPVGEELAAARSAGIVQVDGERVRFTHPLLASVVYHNGDARTRRAVHGELASAVTEPEERARHRAMSVDCPDADAAAELDVAARLSAARGAPAVAAELSEWAAALTPPAMAQDARRRRTDAASHHFLAGDMARARALLEPIVAELAPGAERAAALVRLGAIRCRQDSWRTGLALLQEAVEEPDLDDRLRADAECELAFTCLVTGDLGSAIAYAAANEARARQLGNPEALSQALTMTAAFDFVAGRGVRDDLLSQAAALAGSGAGAVGWHTFLDHRFGAGCIWKWSGRLDEARAQFAELRARALNDGDESALPFIQHHLSELECWAGNWDVARRHAEEGIRIVRQTGQAAQRGPMLYPLALVAAHVGDMDGARSAAEEAVAACSRSGNAAVVQLALTALGFIELTLDNPAGTHQYLGGLAEGLLAIGVGEPGVVRFVPDEVEALLALGHVERADALTCQLEERGRALDRPWALATGARCRALIRAGDGDLQGALDASAEALVHHERLPQPFELGRTLMIRGIIQRRSRQWGAARQSLESSLAIFRHLGAPGWGEKAIRELGRIGGRAPAPLDLTPTEAEVASMVARGLSTREVAGALFLSPRTVEANLTRIYRKLGVRTRAGLANKLGPPGDKGGETSDSSTPSGF